MLKLLIILSLISFRAQAHPVIYKDGIAASTFNMPDYSENYLMYSVSSQWALGLSHYRFVDEDQKTSNLAFVKLNHLLWRRNGEDSQANVYLHGGLGLKEQMAGVEGDWETRTLYTSLKHFEFQTPKLRGLGMTQARIGFSPRLKSFQELQSWVMLQGMYTPVTEKTVRLTPMLRFFYQNILWEMGSSLRGDWMLNLMVHY